MLALLLLPAALQMVAFFVDELVFHRRRGLPLWERVGHPIDTLTAAACYAWLVFTPPDAPHALGVFSALAALSCLVITKDEWVHSRLCGPTENWLHACLFVLHPVVFVAFAVIWQERLAPWVLGAELWAALGLVVYQVTYWSPAWQRRRHPVRP